MIGIIGAMSIEIDGIVEKMCDKTEYVFNGIKFTVGNLCSKSVVACKCGIGKVNSSMATMLMKAKFDIDTVINIGVAGGWKTLKQGDIVIADKTVEHDYDGTPDGLPLGQVHGFDSPYLDCDKQLVEELKNICNDNKVPFVVGTVATGDQFIANNEKSAQITQNFGAVAYDMESGAINHVCKNLGLKFVAIRAISDNGNNDAMDDFYTFVTKAAKNSEEIICAYLKSAD